MPTIPVCRRSARLWPYAIALCVWIAACRPSDVLSVPPPAGVTVASAYNSQSGAEDLFGNGKGGLFLTVASYNGLLMWSGLLGDEFTYAFYSEAATDANIDARRTAAGGGFSEPGDLTIQMLMAARVTLLRALPILKQYEPASGRSKIGEAYALVGYAELLAAEDYCAGLPLGQLVPGVGVQYGTSLTLDSLLSVAETDFDSASANSGGNDTIQGLAAVGLGRTLLNRGAYAAAAGAVQGIPTTFVYNTELDPNPDNTNGNNLYEMEAAFFGCGLVNVGDGKGGNGLNYVSAQDPRLIVSTTLGETCDGSFFGLADSVWSYPTKFGLASSFVPLASGIEARLIEAEAALQGNNPTMWASDLNALRADTADTHAMFTSANMTIGTDSTTGGPSVTQVNTMFRERAFWLYGTGIRLGDMRRLIRQYGRDQSTVYPVGPYPEGHNRSLPTPLPSYGTDVNMTLPTGAGGTTDPNKNFKGCLTSTHVA